MIFENYIEVEKKWCSWKETLWKLTGDCAWEKHSVADLFSIFHKDKNIFLINWCASGLRGLANLPQRRSNIWNHSCNWNQCLIAFQIIHSSSLRHPSPSQSKWVKWEHNRNHHICIFQVFDDSFDLKFIWGCCQFHYPGRMESSRSFESPAKRGLIISVKGHY